MAYGNVQQRFGSTKKRKTYYDDMIQGQADQGIATANVKERMALDLANKERAASTKRWEQDYDLSVESQKQAADATKAGTYGSVAKLGMNFSDQFGGSKFGNVKTGWGGIGGGIGSNLNFGGAIGGAGMGAGLVGMFGGDSKKRSLGAMAGGLLGLLF